MIRRKPEYPHSRADHCHGGEGFYDCDLVIAPGDSEIIEFMHDDRLEPHTSFQEHLHEDSEEIYFVVEGHGTAWLDGKAYSIHTGDVTLVNAGHSHGIVNSGEGPMRLLVVGVKRPRES